MTEQSDAIVIHGITRKGSKFRPSDWAERLCGAMASYGPGRRIRRSPYVRVEVIEGKKCLVVDRGLRNQDPRGFDFLMHFARDNELVTEPDA